MHFDPEHSRLRQKQADSVKRKLDQAIQNTQGFDGHRTYYGGKWLRCLDCTGMSHIDKRSYWINRACNKRYKAAPPNEPNPNLRSYREYLLSHPVENFQLESDSDLELNASQHSEVIPAIPPEVNPELTCTVCSTPDSETEVKACQECEMKQCIICQRFCSCFICHAMPCELCHGRHLPRCLNTRRTEPNPASAGRASVKLQAENKSQQAVHS